MGDMWATIKGKKSCALVTTQIARGFSSNNSNRICRGYLINRKF